MPPSTVPKKECPCLAGPPRHCHHASTAKRADQSPFEPVHQFRRNRLGKNRNREQQKRTSRNTTLQTRPEFAQVRRPSFWAFSLDEVAPSKHDEISCLVFTVRYLDAF